MRQRLTDVRPTTAVAALLVAGLLVTLIARASGVVGMVHANADLAAPLAMSDLLRQYPDAAAMTGNYGWWNGLWVVQVLQAITGGTQAASYLPLVATVAAIGALALRARALFGLRAALVVPLVAGSIGVQIWMMNGAWSGRGPSWWGMVALGLLLVAHAGGRVRPARIPHALLIAAVVLWCAAALSGDALAWTSIVAPAAGVAAVAVLTRRPRAAILPATTAVAIGVLSVAVRAAANHFGYFQRPSPTTLTRFEEAQAGAGNVVVGLESIWRGPDGSTAGAAAGYLGMVLVLVAVGAGVTVLASLATSAWTDRRSESAGDSTAADATSPGHSGPIGAAGLGEGASASQPGTDSGAVITWAAFWTTMVLATAVAFAFSGSSFVGGQPVSRYLFGVPFAAGALLAMLAGRIRVPAMAVAPAGLLAALAILGMARETPPREPLGRSSALSAIQVVARSERVTRGFASYWSSYPLTVSSGFGLRIDPVGVCPSPQGSGLCPMYLHYVDRAYEPQKGIRSFLLVDTQAGSVPGVFVTKAPDGVTPVAVHQIQPGLQMLIYDHDLAADVQPVTFTGEPVRHRGD